MHVTTTILDELKWPNNNHLIIAECLKFIHKPIFECMPPAITNLFASQENELRNTRNLPVPNIKIKPDMNMYLKILSLMLWFNVIFENSTAGIICF